MCVHPGELFDYRKKICRKAILKCRALNHKRNNCATCVPGYELQGRVVIKKGKKKEVIKYKSREYFWKTKNGINQWSNRLNEDWRKNSLKCTPCP